MAKTKEQKQQEAIERKMLFWDHNFETYAKCQYPNELWHQFEKQNGTAYANQRAEDAKNTFARYCKEVGRDFHGNPV